MKVFEYFLTILVILSQVSCLNIIAKKTGLNNLHPELKRLPVENKEVYFLGMGHLAKNEFYENSKQIIKKYQDNGFICYVESVNNFDEINSQIDTQALKKIRKLIGLDITIKYAQMDNPIVNKLVSKFNLVNQPKYNILGAFNYLRVDYNYYDLINIFEKKYNIISLNNCDSTTNLGQKYTCKTAGKESKKTFTEELIITERNKLLIEKILKSQDLKILVIYGKAHLNGILKLLNNEQ